jgi:uncharacterized protein YbjT (DUF2867 family)
MPESKPSILITGGTGNIGQELIKELAARKVPFRAMVRSPKASIDFGEVAELIIGDFNDAQLISAALEGIDRAFLLTNSSELAEAQQTRFAEMASRIGVKQIVKLSQWAADADSPVRFLRYHAAVEKKIRDLGIDYTFLRPNLFMQGLLAFRDSIVSQGRFFAAAGDAKISLVDVRDIAAVAVAALTEQGHEGKIYDLTGSEALTHSEMAEKLSDLLNRKIEYDDVPPQAMLETLISIGLPQWQADGLIEDYEHYRRGEASTIADGVQDATGTAPRSFDQFFK